MFISSKSALNYVSSLVLHFLRSHGPVLFVFHVWFPRALRINAHQIAKSQYQLVFCPILSSHSNLTNIDTSSQSTFGSPIYIIFDAEFLRNGSTGMQQTILAVARSRPVPILLASCGHGSLGVFEI
jgi:hypothetical protein